jgi:hypothetical protein
MRWIYWVLGVGATISIGVIVFAVFILVPQITKVIELKQLAAQKYEMGSPFFYKFEALHKAGKIKQSWDTLKIAAGIEQGIFSMIYGDYACYCLKNEKLADYYYQLGMIDDVELQKVPIVKLFPPQHQHRFHYEYTKKDVEMRKRKKLTKEINYYLKINCPEKLKH